MCLSTIKWTDFLLFRILKNTICQFCGFRSKKATKLPFMGRLSIWNNSVYHLGCGYRQKLCNTIWSEIFSIFLGKMLSFYCRTCVLISIFLRCKCQLSLRHATHAFSFTAAVGGMSKYGRYCNQVLNLLTVLGKQTACVGMPDRGL